LGEAIKISTSQHHLLTHLLARECDNPGQKLLEQGAKNGILLDVLQDHQGIIVADIGDRIDERQPSVPVDRPRIVRIDLAIRPIGLMVEWPPRQLNQAWKLEQGVILEPMSEPEIPAVIVSGKLPVRIGQDRRIAVSGNARIRHSLFERQRHYLNLQYGLNYELSNQYGAVSIPIRSSQAARHTRAFLRAWFPIGPMPLSSVT
jgi:hypothetical protein